MKFTKTLILAFCLAFLASCGTETKNLDDLETLLATSDDISTEVASCIATKIFNEYEQDGDAWDTIAGNNIAGIEKELPGFEKFTQDAIESCSNSSVE